MDMFLPKLNPEEKELQQANYHGGKKKKQHRESCHRAISKMHEAQMFSQVNSINPSEDR